MNRFASCWIGMKSKKDDPSLVSLLGTDDFNRIPL